MDRFFYLCWQKQNFLLYLRSNTKAKLPFLTNSMPNYPLSHTVSSNPAILKVEMCYLKAAARTTLILNSYQKLPATVWQNAHTSPRHSFFSFFFPFHFLLTSPHFSFFPSFLSSLLFSLLFFSPLPSIFLI